jgi:hypothetical protein
MKKPILGIKNLKIEAGKFAKELTSRSIKSLFGVTDGKAVGTYIEHEFYDYLKKEYNISISSSAEGIDFPTLDVDIKVTSIKQPQSSCPFKSARQKIYGLGYSLLIFVYDKNDIRIKRAASLEMKHVVFVDKKQTGDFQTTTGILKIVENHGNLEDIKSFMNERNLPIEEIQADKLAKEILATPPSMGYLTISNALQWRLQYARVIDKAGTTEGVDRII